ncbi:hypothetical protein HHK36_008373 [Tetracentron sinense]|uniref:C2HC zinc finger plants domain-containing protein n=1 Tax=Tetracentron sinense TaxID=13715 RepID=A0A835DJW0_TETSI|nr:hypothetical protein HHK36_008373 [Tetracentron sinense]
MFLFVAVEFYGRLSQKANEGGALVDGCFERETYRVTWKLRDTNSKQVVMAMRSDGGDGAVFQTLHRARELYRNKLQANAAADQLASLFAECAIAEAQPLESKVSPFGSGGTSVTPDAHEASILAESGRKQIVLDAFSDGSSFICLQCGGIVSNHRKDEHFAYWCCKI